MDFLLDALTNWLKEMLVGGIMGNLTGMFDSVNQQVADISVQVGQTPQGWNSGIFHMIQNLSNNVILPIAGIILALGRIVGESAALLFTAGSDYKLPKFTGVFGDNLAKLAHKAMESGGTLTIELYLQMQKGQYDNAFGIGCVLIIIVLILNLLTKLAANKLRRE